VTGIRTNKNAADKLSAALFHFHFIDAEAA
jgi:hypothetical protein